MENKENKLTDKQSKFIDEYMVDLNATQAAIRAGYSAHTAAQSAYETLMNPYIAAELTKRKALVALKCGISKDEIIKDLKDIKDSFKKGKVPANALKAIEILNKMLGYYEAEVVKIDGGLIINYIKPTKPTE